MQVTARRPIPATSKNCQDGRVRDEFMISGFEEHSTAFSFFHAMGGVQGKYQLLFLVIVALPKPLRFVEDGEGFPPIFLLFI